MALTAEHVERITAFTEARILEAREDRWTEQDDISRALRALDSLLGTLRARAELVTPNPWPHPEMDPDGQINRAHLARQKETAATAWDDLGRIARMWDDHPDYHPDFALFAHQFPDAPVEVKED